MDAEITLRTIPDKATYGQAGHGYRQRRDPRRRRDEDDAGDRVEISDEARRAYERARRAEEEGGADREAPVRTTGSSPAAS